MCANFLFWKVKTTKDENKQEKKVSCLHVYCLAKTIKEQTANVQGSFLEPWVKTEFEGTIL